MVNIAPIFGQHIVNIEGIFRCFCRIRFFAWSTSPKNLVNKLGYLANTFCTRNVQNVSKKNRGKNLFSKSLPRISLIISILSFIPLQQPARRQGVLLAHGMVSSWRSSCLHGHRTSLSLARRHARHRCRCGE